MRSLRELLIIGCKGIAAYADHAAILGHEKDDIYGFLMQALASTTKNLSTDEMIAMVMKAGETAVNIMALLDEANTTAYGNPEITEVNIGVGNNPGILISGHDLKDMEELLRQTEGTGLDVYTHGEMLPAPYLNKMKGTTQSPPRVNLFEILCSWVGSLIGIASVGILEDSFCSGTDRVLMMGSFGASAVLLFGAIRSPLAQPRNLLGGHILSALIGVSAYKIFPLHLWLAAAIAVATAIAVMHATKTLHPPGGATALIAVIGGEKIHNLGYLYALMPVGAGAAIMLMVALLVNNLPKTRRYPEFWF